MKNTKDPKHYCGDGRITARVAMRSMLTNAKQKPMVISWWSMAFKYLWRWHLKNGVEDLDKCIDCIEKMKEELVTEKKETCCEKKPVFPSYVIDAKGNRFIYCPSCGSTSSLDEEHYPEHCPKCGRKFVSYGAHYFV